MTSRRVLWAGCLLATALSTGAPRRAGAQVLTLAEVEAKAQRERPELAERRASIDRARAELASVQAKGRPTLGARGDLTLAPGGQLVTITDPASGEEYFVQGSQSLGQGNSALVPRPRYGVMLAGRWTILDFGRSSFGASAAEASISAGRASLLQAKVELVRAARNAYLGWLEAHETWQLSRKDAEVTAARTTSVRALIAEGARPRTDATLSSYDEQLARLREARARRASSLAFDTLSAALQSQLPQASTPDLSVLEVPVPANGAAGPVTGTAQDRAASDPGVELLNKQHAAALSAARAADRGAAPQLDVTAELGFAGQNEEVFPNYRAALSLSVPIYDGGAQSALADQYRAEASGVEAKRQLVANQVRAQQLAAERALEAAGEDLNMTLALLGTAETLLNEAEDHYRAGSDTLERVLSAQRSLVQARREVLTSKLQNARARLELAPIGIRD